MTQYECTECGHRQANPFRRCRACGVAGAVVRLTTPQAPATDLATEPTPDTGGPPEKYVRLAAENARLREALEVMVAWIAHAYDADDPDMDLPELEQARAALAAAPRPNHIRAGGRDGYEWVDDYDPDDPDGFAAAIRRNRKP